MSEFPDDARDVRGEPEHALRELKVALDSGAVRAAFLFPKHPPPTPPRSPVPPTPLGAAAPATRCAPSPLPSPRPPSHCQTSPALRRRRRPHHSQPQAPQRPLPHLLPPAPTPSPGPTSTSSAPHQHQHLQLLHRRHPFAHLLSDLEPPYEHKHTQRESMALSLSPDLDPLDPFMEPEDMVLPPPPYREYRQSFLFASASPSTLPLPAPMIRTSRRRALHPSCLPPVSRLS